MSDKATAIAAAAQDQSVGSPLLKIASAWAAVGITSWADFASFLAAIYTMLLLGEWLWKKLFRREGKKNGRKSS